MPTSLPVRFLSTSLTFTEMDVTIPGGGGGGGGGIIGCLALAQDRKIIKVIPT